MKDSGREEGMSVTGSSRLLERFPPTNRVPRSNLDLAKRIRKNAKPNGKVKRLGTRRVPAKDSQEKQRATKSPNPSVTRLGDTFSIPAMKKQRILRRKSQSLPNPKNKKPFNLPCVNCKRHRNLLIVRGPWGSVDTNMPDCKGHRKSCEAMTSKSTPKRGGLFNLKPEEEHPRLMPNNFQAH